MRNIKLTIEYDGTDYCGWQRQKNGVSIQELIEKALRKILHERIKIIGAARTDSGVHAKGQAANFKTHSKLPLSKLKMALNNNLPRDISVIEIKSAARGFNAQFSAKSKLYRYSIFNRKEKTPFFDKYFVHIPYNLNIQAMRKASKHLIGKHDFSSFKGSKGVTKTQERNIKKILLEKKGFFIFMDIEADGFLYNMARNIVGTLIEAGRNKIKPRIVKNILSLRDRKKAGPTAQAKGLTLVRVEY